MILKFYHTCLVCSNYKEAIDFYINILGFTLKNQTYSKSKKRAKLKLCLDNIYVLELFIYDEELAIFEDTNGSAQEKIDHIAFLTDNVPKTIEYLKEHAVKTTEIMMDTDSGKQYAFFYNPDGVKHEIYSIT